MVSAKVQKTLHPMGTKTQYLPSFSSIAPHHDLGAKNVNLGIGSCFKNGYHPHRMHKQRLAQVSGAY
jgi:hypothetical protein